MDDDIVITGMSGRFPESDNIDELANHLYSGHDVITEDDRRWPQGLNGLPKGDGKLKSLSEFDSEFFGISAKQVENMDPQSRILLEVAYEAVTDAGYSINEFHKSNTGVFLATSATDAKDIMYSNATAPNYYQMMGCMPGFFANRISQALDLRGPSYNLDNGCAGSMTALVQALSALRTKQCDAAIVATANLFLSPHSNLSLQKMNALSPSSRCKTFTADADGYVRSEAVVAILIQRKAASRRIYATIRGGRVNTDGYKPKGFSYPSKDMQYHLAESTFKEAGLSPLDVDFVEAHGTATKAGDFEELSGIVEFFCKGRGTPLLIGSVKSNIGHTEPSSGLCSVVKVLLAMENGIIPGNLHYLSANHDIPALSDGRLKVVDKNTPWNGGIASINSFGFGGSNAHIILESYKCTEKPKANYSIPRLVVVSGRTKEAVHKFLTFAQSHSNNSELHGLLDAVHSKNISGHGHRGYALLGDQYFEEISVLNDNIRRPIWFSFTDSDYYSQPGSIHPLLKLPLFKASIEQSASILKSNGIDLIRMLTEDKNSEDVFNSTVMLVALQIAFVDLLRELDIKPEGTIGFKLGKIGCNYASRDLTLEQAIIYAYWYGCNLSKNENGRLEKFKDGQANAFTNVMKIPANNFFKECQRDNSVPRMPENIPENAILVHFGPDEAPHVILNNNKYEIFFLLDRESKDLCVHFLSSIGKLYNAGAQPQNRHLYPSVMWPVSRGTPGLSSHVIWNHHSKWNIPKYQDLANNNASKIYIDLTTPENAFFACHKINDNVLMPVSGYLFYVWCTLAKIKNVNMNDVTVVFENVQFEKYVLIQDSDNIQLEISILPRTGSFEICDNVKALLATGKVSYTTDEVCHGYVKGGPKEYKKDEILLPLTSEYIYKEYKLRGYDLQMPFCGLLTVEQSFNTATVSWNQNWIAFIDTMFQFDNLGKGTREINLPSQIQRVVINPKLFLQANLNNNNVFRIHRHQSTNSIETVGVLLDNLKWIQHERKSNQQTLTLEKCIFHPYNTENINHDSNLPLTKQDMLTAVLQILLENVNLFMIKICEVLSDKIILMPDLIEILTFEPAVRMIGKLFVGPHCETYPEFSNDDNIEVNHTNAKYEIPEIGCQLIVASNIIDQPNATDVLRNFKLSLASSGMILLKEFVVTFEKVQHVVQDVGLSVVSYQVCEDYAYILMNIPIEVLEPHQIIEISSMNNYQWVNTVRNAVKSDNHSRIYLVAYDYDSGILGMYNCLRREGGVDKIRVYFLPGVNEEFNVNKALYSSQAKRDVAVNILRNGVWGAYRHLKLKKEVTSGLKLKCNFSGNKCYVLIGGLGGFGLELSNWLVMQGVTKLVLNSRRGIQTGYQHWCVKRWQRQGIKVLISTEDASTIDGAIGLLQAASTLGTVGGIFNLAAVLDDAVFANQSPDSFEKVGEPKINVTRSLDIASRELTPDLDHFVVFSSLSCGRGNYGQTNYGYANSAMERIVEQRREAGLPGLAIQWGPIGDTGIMANTSDNEYLQMGTLKQKISSCLQTLEILLVQPYAVVGCCVVADKHKRKNIERVMKKTICERIADIFGITDLNNMSQSTTLRGLGMDSIMAMEIHGVLQVDHGIHLSMDKINELTFAQLKGFDEENLSNNSYN